MELSLTVCKICNQEHTTVGENTENLWINLCMFCKHEIKRTNQFLAQLEKSSSFLISTARIFESVIKTESEEQMGGKNIRLCIDSDKIVLAPELPSAFSFVEKSYSFCEQNSPPIDIKMEYSDDINLKPEAPDPSPFIEDKYSFCEQNSPLMDIEYVGVDEENIFVKVQQTSDRLLPEKSKNRYQHEAVLFKNWQQKNSIKSVTEDVVIAYIDEMSKKYSPSSIYTKTCMLKTTLLAKENIDIFKFEKVNPYLRQHYAGYKSKESKTLSETEVLKFLNEAPDHDYLMQKVVLNFRIFGACRCAELASMKVSDIEDRGSVVVVNIPGTNNYKKSFCLVDDNKFNAIKLYRKYAALRPKEISSDRFFLCYKKGRCVKQVVGKNSFGNLPCKIATYLGLDDAYLYRGHYLRKMSAAHVVDETGGILSPKRSYGSESSSITEHYTDDSMKCHKKIFKLESNQQDFLPEDVNGKIRNLKKTCKLRIQEKPYVTYKGTSVAQKEPPQHYVTCKCQYRCNSLPYEHKEQLFQQFHQLPKEKQGSYLMGLIRVTPVNRRRNGKYNDPSESRRQASMHYIVPDSSGGSCQVCRKTFKEVFALSSRRLQTLQEHLKKGKTTYKDGRGHSRNSHTHKV